MYKLFFKRVFDFSIALIGFVVLLPIFLLCGLIIKISSKGSIFFLQNRIGENGKVFTIYKFRTMTDKIRFVDKEILKGNAEVTKIGYYLRRFKIDELPQIVNIIFGDMSIVGPRPCMPDQMKDFNDDAFFRIKVKPGLTGLAQISGNIYLLWEERWRYDREYVEKLSFILDVKIIFKTIAIVVFGEDKYLKNNNA